MKKDLKRFALTTISIVLMLLLVTACGGSNHPEPTPEPAPIESPEPAPEPTEPIQIEDNRLGVSTYDLINSCPSESLSYDGDLTNCNLDNLVMFSVSGEINNPDKFGVLFYASAYDDYQNEQVAQVLNMINGNFFSSANQATEDILLEAIDSIVNNGATRYLYIDGYEIKIYGEPADNGGGSVASYFITKQRTY